MAETRTPWSCCRRWKPREVHLIVRWIFWALVSSPTEPSSNSKRLDPNVRRCMGALRVKASRLRMPRGSCLTFKQQAACREGLLQLMLLQLWRLLCSFGLGCKHASSHRPRQGLFRMASQRRAGNSMSCWSFPLDSPLSGLFSSYLRPSSEAIHGLKSLGV